MQSVRGITDVSQCCLNLRWLMRQRCADPSMWAVELNKLTRTYLGFSRASVLRISAFRFYQISRASTSVGTGAPSGQLGEA